MIKQLTAIIEREDDAYVALCHPSPFPPIPQP